VLSRGAGLINWNSARNSSPRILLIAEAANPEWVSVPLVGWNIYRALSEVANVHLVTQARNREAIGRAGLVEGKDYSIVDNERIAALLYKLSAILRGGAGKGWTTVTAIASVAYYSFELDLWRKFKGRLMAREFDIVHRVTPLSPTNQSIIAKRLSKLGIPFVVGPLNGGVPWPQHFIDRQHAEREWLSHIRGLYKLMPGYSSMRRYSSAILVGSEFTYSEMPHQIQKKCVYIPENGVWTDQVIGLEALKKKFEAPYGGRKLRAIFVGRLVPYKGADMLLNAASEFLRNGQVELQIVGDGPQRVELEALVQKLGIQRAVHFQGLIPHAEVLRQLQKSDFMILPSIREFGGGVVIESMAMAVTPIVANYAGPAELVDDSTGVRVAFRDRDTLVANLKAAIGEVVGHPEQLIHLGYAARQKVLEKFTWEAKSRQILEVYSSVLAGDVDLSHLYFQ
jgi:glycosyltransferase involved in cell wall biosynthesis